MGKGGKDASGSSPITNVDMSPASTATTYTVSQVNECDHMTAKDSPKLVIFGDDVYDISSWISKHPGGETVLKQYSGRDITDAFRAYHSENGKSDENVEIHARWRRSKKDFGGSAPAFTRFSRVGENGGERRVQDGL